MSEEQCPHCGHYCTGKSVYCTKGSELSAPAGSAFRPLCKTHPEVNYKTEWGCPQCVVELREENDLLKSELEKRRLDSLRWVHRYQSLQRELQASNPDGSVLPCPHCGRKPSVVFHPNRVSITCCCEGDAIATVSAMTEAQAVKGWNRRSPNAKGEA